MYKFLPIYFLLIRLRWQLYENDWQFPKSCIQIELIILLILLPDIWAKGLDNRGSEVCMVEFFVTFTHFLLKTDGIYCNRRT